MRYTKQKKNSVGKQQTWRWEKDCGFKTKSKTKTNFLSSEINQKNTTKLSSETRTNIHFSRDYFRRKDVDKIFWSINTYKYSEDGHKEVHSNILKSHSQFTTKKMQKMSEDIYTPEHTFRTKTDLNLSGVNQPTFKSILDSKVSENISSSQNLEFSNNTSFARATCFVPSQNRIFAYIVSNNNINIIY